MIWRIVCGLFGLLVLLTAGRVPILSHYTPMKSLLKLKATLSGEGAE